MQNVVGLLLCCWLGVVLAEGEIPDCLGLSPEKLAQLNSLVVTENIHDKLAGNHTYAWGPKTFVEEDDTACIKYTWTKVDDTHANIVLHTSGTWFGGRVTRNLTAEKVENGVYLLKKTDGTAVMKEYHLSDKKRVRATFVCALSAIPPDSKHAVIPYFSGVVVQYENLPLTLDILFGDDDGREDDMDALVKRVKDHKDLLKEIVEYPDACEE